MEGAITWSLSGDDSGDFSLAGESAARRVLNFQSSPNYENPTDEDTDNQYDVTIHASDGANTSSLQVVVSVTNVRHDPDELPVITGTARVGETLTVDTSPIRETDENTTFGDAWIRTDGGTDTTIEGANSSSYTLTDTDEGKNIKVQLGLRTTSSEFLYLISAPTEVVAKPNSPATGAPTISGTAQVDQTLTADTSGITDADGLTSVSFEYQWLAGGSDISGATGFSYLLTSSEQGQTIQVRVTFTAAADNEETLTSIATAAVAAAPEPLTIRLKVAAPTSHDGSSEFTFEIEFSEEFGLSYVTLKSHAFNVTGGSVERAQRTDKPSNIPWLITVKPHGTGDVTIELPATTDCNAEGAICTADGRKLSNSLSFTVSGPGQ